MIKRLSVLLACGLAMTSLAKAAETPGGVEWAAKHAEGQSGSGLMQGFSTQMVKMYLAPGQNLMGEFNYGNTSDTVYGDNFSFSGYLVDAN